MTCSIVDKNVNNFSKTSGIAVMNAIADYDSLYIYASSVLFASSVTCLLSVPRLLCLYLRLLCLSCLFHYFYCKLYRITVTYYIVNKKTNDLKTSSFTIVVIVCVFFCT